MIQLVNCVAVDGREFFPYYVVLACIGFIYLTGGVYVR